jgi:hypothetical protein
MYNLYSLKRSAAEIAAHFGVNDPPALDFPAEVKPSESGIVVRQGASGLRRKRCLSSETTIPQPIVVIAHLAQASRHVFG